AVSLMNTCCSPRHEGVAIYDDGVRRTGTTPGHTGANTITFGEDGSVLYGYNTETSEDGFRTMQVTSAGVRETRVTGGVSLGFGLRYFGGRVYGTGNEVIDGSRHLVVGTLPGVSGGSIAVDGALGRVFHLDTWEDQVRVFDMNNFQLLGTIPMSGLNSEHPVLARERVVRWGTDGLAVSDGSAIYIFRSPIAGP
ncbi:MAG TPA: hypothetical protein VGX50_07530, partial [Longimicrobium sp.]|nr:hypothetical protein [Longimicrobium sp.]